MGFLSPFQKPQKNTRISSNSNIPVEKTADSIIKQRGNQIKNGLNKTTASTGTPMEQLHGGAKRMAQLSNIGGGSKATGGGGIDEGMNAMMQYTQAITVKNLIKHSEKKKISGKK